MTSFYGHDAGNSASMFAKVYRGLIIDGDCFLALSKDMEKDLMGHGFDGGLGQFQTLYIH